jgi:hypothetical protein
MTIVNSVMLFIVMPLQGLGKGGQPIYLLQFRSRKFSAGKAGVHVIAHQLFLILSVMCVSALLFPSGLHLLVQQGSVLIRTDGQGHAHIPCGHVHDGVQFACQQSFIASGTGEDIVVPRLAEENRAADSFGIDSFPDETGDDRSFLAEPIADFLAAGTTAVLFFSKFDKILAWADVEHPR